MDQLQRGSKEILLKNFTINTRHEGEKRKLRHKIRDFEDILEDKEEEMETLKKDLEEIKETVEKYKEV